MAKSFYTTGTGDEQTLTPIINEKVPIYDTIADAESDLSNLEVGQIVKTKDAGLVANLNPIDEIKDGVFLPPTSNAVAKSLSYSTTEQKTGGKWIDGKDIYRRTFDETFNATTSDILIPNTSGLNIDSIVNSNWYLPSEKMYLAVSKLSVLNGSLYIRGSIAVGNVRNLVTIEYTKTTD